MKILKYMVMILFFGFSFFYTDKAVNLIRDLDPLINDIKDNIDAYEKGSIDAVFKGDEMVPGLSGCSVDINKSYINMKKINTYNEKLLVFNEIKPNISINNSYDRYIVSGNKELNNISIIIKIDDTSNMQDLISYIEKKGIGVNFFMDGSILEENIVYINRIKNNNEIYNGGYKNKYEKDYIFWTNNLINTLTNNKSNYCVVTKKDSDVLSICSSNKMYTILTKVVVKNNYLLIGEIIEKGSILYMDGNEIDVIKNTINYILRKGYNILLLSEFLSEKNC